jgi:hypothetical protein
MRYLLDKNIVRYAITGLHYGRQRPLSLLEMGALSFWRTVETHQAELFISDVTFQVIHRLSRYSVVGIFLDSVQILLPTRYRVRWARRIRETTGLSREDAAIIALASFGTNSAGTILGVHRLITYDQSMITGYINHLPILKDRLRAMISQVPTPFDQTTLPQLVTPDEAHQEQV